MADKILRLCDIVLEKEMLEAWKSGKICCPNTECSSCGSSLFHPEGLSHHYRINHKKCQCGEAEIKLGKEALRKLVAAETLGNLLKLSNQRKKQENAAHIYETCRVEYNGQNIELIATNDKEAAKLFGLYLYHKGDVKLLEAGNRGVSVTVKNDNIQAIYSLWKNKEKIYAEATFYKRCHSMPLEVTALPPCHAVVMDIPGNVSDNDRPLYVMNTVFGYEKFREGQREAIQSIMSGKDSVILMPTGGGKSLIFTVAAIFKQGLTVVIEPLKFLMEEQVARLRDKGVSAFYFNSSLTNTEMDFVIHNLTRFTSQYVILFTSPECILGERLQNVLIQWNAIKKLGFIAIDEAHCIDSWGPGFRPQYTRLGELKTYGTVVAAFTGTATPNTIQVLIKNLKLDECNIVKTSFFRDNLFMTVVDKKENAKQQVVKIILEQFQNICGIVYCAKRQDAVDMAQELKEIGITSTYVHGALADIERKKHEELWSSGHAFVMCATNCFGMGINKGDVRFVIHLSFPACLEDYYQEAGRAGRDGNSATCITLFKFDNRTFHMHNIYEIEDDALRNHKYTKLNRATQFFSNSNECRHVNILSYFGEDASPCEDMCDVCTRGPGQPTIDLKCDKTELAKLVIHCVVELQPLYKTSVNLIAQILLGSVSAEIMTNGLDKLETYSTAKKLLQGRNSRKLLIKFIYKLILNDFLRENRRVRSSYSSITLSVGNIKDLMSGNTVIH